MLYRGFTWYSATATTPSGCHSALTTLLHKRPLQTVYSTTEIQYDIGMTMAVLGSSETSGSIYHYGISSNNSPPSEHDVSSEGLVFSKKPGDFASFPPHFGPFTSFRGESKSHAEIMRSQTRNRICERWNISVELTLSDIVLLRSVAVLFQIRIHPSVYLHRAALKQNIRTGNIHVVLREGEIRH